MMGNISFTEFLKHQMKLDQKGLCFYVRYHMHNMERINKYGVGVTPHDILWSFMKIKSVSSEDINTYRLHDCVRLSFLF